MCKHLPVSVKINGTTSFLFYADKNYVSEGFVNEKNTLFSSYTKANAFKITKYTCTT